MEYLLLKIIGVLLGILLALWISIFVSLEYRKYHSNKRKLLKRALVEIIMMDPTQRNSNTSLSNFASKLIKGRHFNFLVTQLEIINHYFLFNDEEHHIKNRLQIGNRIDNAIKSHKWFEKALSIWSAYEIQWPIKNKLLIILANSNNIYVRREAQIALIQYSGWQSLSLFQNLEVPISLWQQIRIIEKLTLYHPQVEINHLSNAFSSANLYVNELCIRIIQQFDIKGIYRKYILDNMFSDAYFLAETAFQTYTKLDWSHEEQAYLLSLPQRKPTHFNFERTAVLLATNN